LAVKKKPKRRWMARVLVSLASILLVVLGLAGAVVLYAKITFEAAGPLAEDRIFMVSRGMSTPAIAQGLEEAGIISDENVFLAAAYATRNYRRMKAGEYLFAKNASMADVMALIVSGKELVYKVSVPEGWTVSQVVERVSAHESLAGEISEAPPEGSILPDTYLFRRGMTRERLIGEMREAQEKLLEDLWAKRAANLPFKTPEEALILASIVEKETAIPAERPLIAAVFLNRLRAGMRLQSDPTIIYGITGGKTRLDRPILKSDIETTTPFNTYRIAGLPPTPIANPGRESIAAVLNPIESKALYFVADGTGGHVFAESLEDHRKNVRKWRVVERALVEEADEAEAEAVAKADKTTPVTAEMPASADAAPEEEQASLADPPANEEPAPAESDSVAPQESASAEQPGVSSAPAAPAATAAQQKPNLPEREPGTTVVVSGKLVPIPEPRPQRN
jgi:UPF0755 protein